MGSFKRFSSPAAASSGTQTLSEGRLGRTVLVVAGTLDDIGAVVASMREEGLSPIVAFGVEHGIGCLETEDPAAVLLLGVSAGAEEIVAHSSVPVFVVGEPGANARLLHEASPAALFSHDVPASVVARAVASTLGVAHDEIVVGPLRVATAERCAYVLGRRVDLPPIEFALLLELARYAGRPLTSRDLMAAAWPGSVMVTSQDVHRHVYNVRSLLGDQERAEPLIVNRRGFGYVLRAANV